jgi:hypothetical protein
VLLESYISSINSIVALLVSITALIYTVKTYILKSGAEIRGMYSVTSSMYCDDKYVGSVSLENMKDRATVIFKIYLLIGRNNYIEIEDFEDKPLILNPFEVYSKVYDPIDLYVTNMKRIELNELWGSKKIKPQIVLSTSDGKYKVTQWIKSWDPIIDYFNNHMISIIQPMRSTYKNKCYGSNVKYILDIKVDNDKEEVIPICPKDYQFKNMFKGFRLTQESLETKDSLEEFLYEKMGEGSLNCLDITVHDVEVWREKAYEDHNKTIEAEHYNWFFFNIIGPIFTKINSYKIKQINRKSQKSANKALKRN